MEATSAERQIVRGFVEDVQSHSSGLDKLLWELLQICALPDLETSEQDTGQVGDEEIQEVKASSAACGVLVRENSPKGILAIPALADGHKTDGWMMGAR